MTTVKKVKYAGWENCYKIENNQVQVIITSEVGPRIINYSFIGKENHMKIFDDTAGLTGGDEWNIYGGHRLWHSPEAMPRSYAPDNKKVDITVIENGVSISQATEKSTFIKKDLQVTLDSNSTKVTIKHYLTNKGLWDIELAAWALTVMAPGGLEIIPQEQKDTNLLPNRMLSLWPYTKLNDHRVTWGNKYIFIKQDPTFEPPFKIGLSNTPGWAAYNNFNQLFIKKFKHIKDAIYPDYSGSSYETYTKNDMIELESLSPIILLAPEETIEHIETWELFDNINLTVDEELVDKLVLPLI